MALIIKLMPPLLTLSLVLTEPALIMTAPLLLLLLLLRPFLLLPLFLTSLHKYINKCTKKAVKTDKILNTKTLGLASYAPLVLLSPHYELGNECHVISEAANKYIVENGCSNLFHLM